MVGWHHRLNGHEFEETPGVGDGQGGLVCPHLEGRQAPQASSAFRTPTAGSLQSWAKSLGNIYFCP